MNRSRENLVLETLVECQRIYDSTGSVDACIEQHSEFRSEIVEYFALIAGLKRFEISTPVPFLQDFGRTAFLRAVTSGSDNQDTRSTGRQDDRKH